MNTLLTAELKRKGFHFTSLFIPVGIYILQRRVAIVGLIMVTLLVLLVEYLRRNSSSFSRIFHSIFGPILRDHEHESLTGSTFLLLACLICTIFYRREVAIAAILFLVLGDVAAALVGKTVGRIHIGRKTLEGSAACLVVCVLVALAVPDLPLRAGIIGALVATVIEALSIPIDDNFSIPVISGFSMQALVWWG